MRIIVSGASGFVGRHLMPRLAALGHQAVPLARRDAASNAAQKGRLHAPADLASLDPDGLTGERGFDVALHLAALNPDRRDRASSEPGTLLRANRDGTRAFARAAANAGVRHFIYLSTANVHGPQPTAIREDSPVQPASAYARSKAEGEDAARAVTQATGMGLTILRPAPVYGAGGRGMVAALQRLAQTAAPIPMPTGLRPRSVVSVASLVAAILAVIEREGADGAAYLVADETPHTPREIVAGIRRGLGRRPLIVPVPAWAVTLATKPLGLAKTLENFQKPFVLDWQRLAADTTWRPEGDTIAAMLRDAGDRTGH
ncbi:NAD-dependent epimerase/dehydratase family protein [Fulvimarina sp. 2208YS6-2-32]|uniref:NAD-dependent epimerase/dehydratase family protein n=1 Tax=Fulvimarina uroteuthidis TaxID=3098149 RepID=A0ABU5I713_9HYPH|nr:NAD-dependent epimerase/dehydratase family protein [Fulvimarina sp. 2208YS6-2-32]MDY8111182.1 NAD-dependent epimerase/dehydratase family protein [Fulvimarina sp. 2208YS6-2-32]